MVGQSANELLSSSELLSNSVLCDSGRRSTQNRAADGNSANCLVPLRRQTNRGHCQIRVFGRTGPHFVCADLELPPSPALPATATM